MTINGTGVKAKDKKKGNVRFADVQNEREELFAVGDDSEDEREEARREGEGIGSVPRRGTDVRVREQPKQAVLSSS